MSKNRGKSLPPKQGKNPAPPPAPRRAPATEVEPMSPLGLVLAIVAALAIAGILLFVINTRINAANPAPATPAAVAPRPATATPAAQAPAVNLTQTGGFSKGNAQAKVIFTEFADFK